MTILDEVKDHYSSVLGPRYKVRHLSGPGQGVEVLRWEPEANPERVYLYATVGGSAQPIPDSDPTHRTELYMGLMPDAMDPAAALATAATHHILQGVEVSPGDTVSFDQPFMEGSYMTSLWVRLPRYADIVPPLVLADSTHVQFLMAIPLHSSEVAFIQKHGPEALMDRWTDEELPYWDPLRPPTDL